MCAASLVIANRLKTRKGGQYNGANSGKYITVRFGVVGGVIGECSPTAAAAHANGNDGQPNKRNFNARVINSQARLIVRVSRTSD